MIGLWTMDIPTIVFSRVTSEFSEELKTKYGIKKTTVKLPGMTEPVVAWNKFSTSQVSESLPEFPYITIIELPGQERGQDLEGSSINGALFTFQVDVYDNAGDSRPKNCMAEIVRIMKSMRFQVNAMPSFDNKPQEYRMTARFSRVVGYNDSL